MKQLLLHRPGTLALAWALFVFALCATPGQYIPQAWWLELLSFDKLVHASLFFILAGLCFLWLRANNRNGARWQWVLICATYGVLLEVMQSAYFTNRSTDWKDAVANTLGCLLALWLFPRIERKWLSV